MSGELAELRAFDVLKDLDEVELEVLLRHAESRTYARGEYLFREGEPGDAIYLVAAGIVVAERSVADAAGTAKDLAILPTYSIVGDMAIADDEPRSASVRAEIPSRAYRIGRDNFQRITTESPGVARKLFRTLFVEVSRRLRVTNDELVAVYEVGRLVASAGESRSVAAPVIDSILHRLDAGFALVALYDIDGNDLVVTLAMGVAARAPVGTRIPLSGGLAARAYDERKPILVVELLGATDPWESPSLILAPLVVRDTTRGLLLLGQRRSGLAYDLSDLGLASAVANISAPVLVN